MFSKFERFYVPKQEYQRIYDEMSAAESMGAWEAFREMILNQWFDLYVEGLNALGYTEVDLLQSYDTVTSACSYNLVHADSDRRWTSILVD
jgi:hypothetical protein